MDLDKNEIVLSKNTRPFWHIIIAAVFYLSSLGVVIYAFYMLFAYPNDISVEKDLGGYLTIALFALAAGLGFSVIKTRYLNLEKEKLQTEFSQGLFKIKFYSSMPELKYVSVFNNIGAEQFEVNLWYEGNKHFNVLNFDEAQPAIDYGRLFSEKLNLKLLDATEKGNTKWI